MLPKKYRLTVAQFYQLPKTSKDFRSFFLDIKVKKDSLLKFVVVAPKKLDKRSSLRNLTRRIIKEAIRKNLLSIKKPAYVYVKAKKIARKTERLVVEKEISLLLKKADLL